MLNLDETIFFTSKYNNQNDFLLKGILSFFGIFVILDIVRNQVSEVKLLQLVPGFYLILLFICFLNVLLFSTFFSNLSKEGDNKKQYGTKTLNKLKIIIFTKFKFFLFFTVLLVILNTIIPLSLDSFNNYGEKTLENLWSLDEVLTLEIILLVLLLLLSQFPVFIISYLTSEIRIISLPEYWKLISFLIFLASGLVTPTIDGYTQLSFAISALSLYLLVINLLQKRIKLKINFTFGLS
jgi:hypothetical protein